MYSEPAEALCSKGDRRVERPSYAIASEQLYERLDTILSVILKLAVVRLRPTSYCHFVRLVQLSLIASLLCWPNLGVSWADQLVDKW